MKFLFTCFLVLFSHAVMAGGSYHPVRVIGLEVQEDGMTFLLRAETLIEPRPWMDSECKKIVVTGTFDSKRWKKYKRPMSLGTHLDSLAFLKKAESNQTVIMLGYIGNGLIKNKKCSYESKGLFLEANRVFSVNGYI